MVSQRQSLDGVGVEEIIMVVVSARQSDILSANYYKPYFSQSFSHVSYLAYTNIDHTVVILY